MDALDPHGVLRHHRRHRARAEDAECVEGFQVGLDARPTAAIRTRDREGPGLALGAMVETLLRPSRRGAGKHTTIAMPR